MLSMSVPLGILVGWLRRGRLENLARLDGRAAIVAVGAFLIHYLLYRTRGGSQPAVLMLAELALYGGVFVAVAMHRQRAGAWLVGAGGGLNLIAIAAHGGRMPVWLAATGRLSPPLVAQLQAGRMLTDVAMASPHGAGWIGDVIALPWPLPAQVLSLGDLVLIVGIVVFLSTAMVARQY